jgi:hypothetical protein
VLVNVVGLHVAVDDALIMCRGQGLRDLACDLGGARARQPARREHLLERLSVDEIHDVVVESTFFADLVHRHHVRVLDPGQRLGVVAEHLPRRSRPETPDDLRVGARLNEDEDGSGGR